MTTISEIIPFVKFQSRKSIFAIRYFLSIIFILIIPTSGYLVHIMCIHYDYSLLKEQVETDIMKGQESIYDYKIDIHKNYPIYSLDDYHVSDDAPMTGMFLGYSIETLASMANMQRITPIIPCFKYPNDNERFSRTPPFSFISLKIYSKGEYSAERYNVLGIGYKYSDNGFYQLDNPSDIYKRAFMSIKEEYASSSYIDNSYSEIVSIIPPDCYSMSDYDITHLTSRFHAIDRYNRDNISSGNFSYPEISTTRATVFLEKTSTFLKIVEKEDNIKLLDNILLITSVVIIISFLLIFKYFTLPKINKKLKYSGVIWVNHDDNIGVIFENHLLSRPTIRFISPEGDKKYTYYFSPDNTKIRLSDGRIINIEKNNVDMLELTVNGRISTFTGSAARV